MVAAERETREGGREVRVMSGSLCDPTQANLVFFTPSLVLRTSFYLLSVRNRHNKHI